MTLFPFNMIIGLPSALIQLHIIRNASGPISETALLLKYLFYIIFSPNRGPYMIFSPKGQKVNFNKIHLWPYRFLGSFNLYVKKPTIFEICYIGMLQIQGSNRNSISFSNGNIMLYSLVFTFRFKNV